MHHLAAWFENIDTGAAQDNISALVDQCLNTDGDNIRVPADMSKVMALYVLGVDITRAQFQTPSLRNRTLEDIAPLDAAAEPSVPVPWMPFPERPIQLIPSENMTLGVINDGGSASDVFGAVWLTDGDMAVPAGEVFTVRATAATTTVANAWTLCPLTFSQTLPAGRYAIIGMLAHSANAILARLQIPGYQYRPGVICHDAVTDADVQMFRMGRLGTFGEFEQTAPPQLEILTTAADSAETVYLDLVQIRAGPA